MIKTEATMKKLNHVASIRHLGFLPSVNRNKELEEQDGEPLYKSSGSSSNVDLPWSKQKEIAHERFASSEAEQGPPTPRHGRSQKWPPTRSAKPDANGVWTAATRGDSLCHSPDRAIITITTESSGRAVANQGHGSRHDDAAVVSTAATRQGGRRRRGGRVCGLVRCGNSRNRHCHSPRRAGAQILVAPLSSPTFDRIEPRTAR